MSESSNICGLAYDLLVETLMIKWMRNVGMLNVVLAEFVTIDQSPCVESNFAQDVVQTVD